MKFKGLKKNKKLLIGGVVLAIIVVIVISIFAKKKPIEVVQEVKNVKTEKNNNWNYFYKCRICK
ncbi:cell division protein FtsL [Clostridium beijerinckii]|nr:hypothetical protein [Clostridium beijerinckii]NRZ37985.1 cell division protein FtsL [Clostridium beijerinckii]